MACVTPEHMQFVYLINGLRMKHGLRPVKIAAKLHDAAAVKAGQLAALGSIIWDGNPHTINGVTYRDLLTQHGYPTNTWSGENLLYGADTADEAFDIWFKSAPHLENMLNPNYTEIGIAGPVGGSWRHEGDVFDVWALELGGSATEGARMCESGQAPPPPPPRPRPRQKPKVPRKKPPRHRRLAWWEQLLRRSSS